MDETNQTDMAGSLKKAVDDILSVIEQDREREIITRRFGLFDRKETLEQIGELLGITRERVRQLEKAILIRLKLAADDNKIPSVHDVERTLIRHLSEKGRVARVHDVASDIVGDTATPIHRSHIAFISELSPHIAVVGENDDYYHSIGIKDHADEKKIKTHVEEIVKTIKQHGEPMQVEALHAKLSHEHPDHVRALASISKKLASLKDQWGLAKWPTVNPKNIRDKIYVILADNGKPMHFSEIAKTIKKSDFKRKDVTTQAIHNELIKDKRFVSHRTGHLRARQLGIQQGDRV